MSVSATFGAGSQYNSVLNNTPTTGTYRNYLQSIANTGGINAQEAGALLQVAGDDGKLNSQFLSDPYGYTNTSTGHIVSNGTGYGPQGASSLNDIYYGAYSDGQNGKVLGASTASSNGSGSGSGSGTSNGYTAADVTYLQGQLAQYDRLLASLGVTEQTGLQNLGNDYATTNSRALQDQAVADKAYNTQDQQNQTSKLNSLNKINDSADNTYNGIMRNLGIHGAGVSSAAQILAPYAVSKQAGSQRADQFQTFGDNAATIAASREANKTKYQRLFEDLTGQRDKATSDFKQGLVNQQNTILGSKAQADVQLANAQGGNAKTAMSDYYSKMAINQNTLDNLIRQYTTNAYTYAPISTDPANQAQYTTDPQALAGNSIATDPTATDVNAYLPYFQQKKDLGLL
jgi:hypothetical protein